MPLTSQQKAAIGDFKKKLHFLGGAIDAALVQARIITNRECDIIDDADLAEAEITQLLISDSLALAAAISGSLSADRGEGNDTFQVVLDKAREL